MWTQPTASAYVTSGYGKRTPVALPGGGMSSANHAGTDYRAPTGTNVRAAGDGTVTTVTTHKARGKYVVISHGDGTSTLYQHLSAVSVAVGASVAGGAVIGKAGATGAVKGAHLHFEAFVTATGVRVDPVPYLASRIAGNTTAPKPPAPKPAPPAGPRKLGSRELRRGMTGPDVGELQDVLNAWYPAVPTRPTLVHDDSYGGRTTARVKYLQTRARIDPDGIAGRDTFRVLHIPVTY